MSSFSKSVVKKDRNRDHRARRESDPSFLPQVVAKLRRIPSNAALTNQEVMELAGRLTDPTKLIQYFDLMAEEQEGAAGGAEVDTVPVQLVLKVHQQDCKPGSIESVLLEEYGALHVYLIIANLILEWDWTSLVIPHGRPIQEAAAPVDDVVVAELGPMKTGLLTGEVLSIVARYNRLRYFHAIQRSSHDFVREILEKLNFPPPPQLQSNMKKYFDYLEHHKHSNIKTEYESHSDLDRYVMEHRKNFNAIDKEYIAVHYFLFHFTSRMKSANPSLWICAERECKMSTLIDDINPGDMKINNFKTIRYNFRGSTSSESLKPLF